MQSIYDLLSVLIDNLAELFRKVHFHTFTILLNDAPMLLVNFQELVQIEFATEFIVFLFRLFLFTYFFVVQRGVGGETSAAKRGTVGPIGHRFRNGLERSLVFESLQAYL